LGNIGRGAGFLKVVLCPERGFVSESDRVNQRIGEREFVFDERGGRGLNPRAVRELFLEKAA